jgi:carbon monoxide dehydrogenase subunit G
VDRAWDVLLDVERIAPCMPGATIDEFDGEVVTGRIKVKVGPVSLTYRGTAKFTERDPDAKVMVIEASGREIRGAGTASAAVRASLEPESGGEATKVSMHTTMKLTGRPAQFGRGVMVEVGGKLVEQFATNLAQQLASETGVSAAGALSTAAAPLTSDVADRPARSTGTAEQDQDIGADTGEPVSAAAAPLTSDVADRPARSTGTAEQDQDIGADTGEPVGAAAAPLTSDVVDRPARSTRFIELLDKFTESLAEQLAPETEAETDKTDSAATALSTSDVVNRSKGSAGIFISYRRDDASYPAGWLHDRLASHFGRGQVFKDVDSIQYGDDFVERITAAVGVCEVMLAVIGSRWLTVMDTDGRRRLDNPTDYVRLEIEAALERDVRIIPVLVEGAKMPSAAELPTSLEKLTRRHALTLRPESFASDTGRLLEVLNTTLTSRHDARNVDSKAPQ